MVIQLVAYFVFSLRLYHSSGTFQFINIFLFEKCAFVLKSQVALNELEPNSTNIMCSSIIEKYINCHNQYESLSLAKFCIFYNIKKKDFKTSQTQKLLILKIIINI
jgi:dipeptidase